MAGQSQQIKTIFFYILKKYMGKPNLKTQHHFSSLTLKNKICRHKHIKICTVSECQKLLMPNGRNPRKSK